MSEHAEGTFAIDAWETAEPSEHQGSRVERVHAVKTYEGDLAGVGTLDMATSSRGEGSVGRVGVERFAGTLHGRTGEFTLTYDSVRGAGEPWLEWRVGDGAGDLATISGLARIIVDPGGLHTYALDYDLPPRRRMPWRRPGPAAGHRPI